MKADADRFKHFERPTGDIRTKPLVGTLYAAGVIAVLWFGIVWAAQRITAEFVARGPGIPLDGEIELPRNVPYQLYALFDNSVAFLSGDGIYTSAIVVTADGWFMVPGAVDNSRLREYRLRFRDSTYEIQEWSVDRALGISFVKIPVDSIQPIAFALRASDPAEPLYYFGYPPESLIQQYRESISNRPRLLVSQEGALRALVLSAPGSAMEDRLIDATMISDSVRRHLSEEN